jgi:AcrR family transcriptional regulator
VTTPAPAPRPRRTRDGEATRQRLLRAALELFTTTGFHGTTTPALAARAGVAEGTIYRHFAGKEALYAEVVRGTAQWAHGVVAEVEADRTVPAVERLRRLARRFVEGAERDPAAARLLFRRTGDVPSETGSRAALADFQAGVERLVAAAKGDGLVRPGPAELWAAVWLALVGFVAEKVAAKEWEAESATVEQALQAAWDAIATR